MSVKVYVPGDAAALSVGADPVAKTVADQIASRRLEAAVVRNGSRGMFWLEPFWKASLTSFISGSPRKLPT